MNQKCPFDNLKLNIEDIVPCLLAAKMIARLKVRCLHKGSGAQGQLLTEGKAAKRAKLNGGQPCKPVGCGWTGELDRRQAHLDADCTFQLIPCSNDGCTKQKRRCDILGHQQHCSKRVQKCQHCAVGFAHDNLPAHETQCSHRVALCRRGCGIAFAIRRVDGHEASVCPKMIVKCPFARVG
jgi:hypothetical protein